MPKGKNSKISTKKVSREKTSKKTSRKTSRKSTRGRSRFGIETDAKEVCHSLRDELTRIKGGGSSCGEECKKNEEKLKNVEKVLPKVRDQLAANDKIFIEHKRVLSNYVKSKEDSLQEGWADEFDKGVLLIKKDN